MLMLHLFVNICENYKQFLSENSFYIIFFQENTISVFLHQNFMFKSMCYLLFEIICTQKLLENFTNNYKGKTPPVLFQCICAQKLPKSIRVLKLSNVTEQKVICICKQICVNVMKCNCRLIKQTE